MKNKYNKLLSAALPGIIGLPALIQSASAATINPDGFGNVLITTTDSGINNLLVPDGQPAGAHEIRFDPNTFISPAGASSIDLRVTDGSGASYTINMGTGSSIDSGANDGITTANTVGTAEDLQINADGTITGANGISGGLGLINVLNNSSITGNAGAGINSTGTVNLTNTFFQPTDIARSVTGSTNGVVGTGTNSVINNFGTITGQAGNGVIVGDFATVGNLTTIDNNSPFSAPIFGGQIAGSVNGVTAGNNLILNNNNLGQITGTTGNGINAGTGADITNALGATISGGDRGVSAGNGLMLTNDGSISGGTGNGVTGNNDSIIRNTGTITSTSNDAVETFAASGTTFTLFNTGLLSGGGQSFVGSGSDDTLNLNFGSRLLGRVSTLSGNDTINFDGGLTSFHNMAHGASSNSILANLAGVETINKTGTGVAFIGVPGNGGFNVNSDEININSGGLYINANITGENVAQTTINSGGAALGGTGIWNANVNVTAGGISAGAIPINLDAIPSNSVGLLTITGVVDHSPGSFIRFDVNPGTIANGVNSDLIRQTGLGNTYDIDGANIRIASTNNNLAIRNGVYTVVDSDEAITGMLGGVTVQLNPNVNAADTGFVGSQIDKTAAAASNNANTVLANNFTVASKSPDLTNLLLTVNHDFSSLVVDPNAAAFGNALDASIDSTNAIDQDFIAALDNSDLATVQATLNSASPTSSFATTAAIVSGNYRLHRLVQDHLAFTRAAGDSVRSYVGDYSPTQPVPPQPAQAARNGGNVWGAVSYAWKEIDSNLGNDFDGEEASFTAGIDYRVAPNLLLGILVDGSTADYDFSGGSSDVDSFRAAIYGTYGQATGIYADFLAGYGTHDTDLSRNGGLLGSLTSSPDAESFQAMLTVGYAIQSGAVKHGPFGGAEYQNIDVDSFTQGGLFPLGVNGYDVESLRLLVGYRVEMEAGRFSPYASVAYAHELKDDAFNTTATLPGGAGFGVTGSGLESAILISIGTNYALTDNLNLNTGYHGELSVGGDGTDSHGATIGLNYAF